MINRNNLNSYMQVFVFDLDFTIWNAGGVFCSETNPPYTWKKGKLSDQSGRWIRLYPDVIKILMQLRQKNKTVASASRTYEPLWAMDLLQIFGIDKYFDIHEIYSGSKIKHLNNIREKTNYPFDQIVFFDDEKRNIDDAKSLGIESILVSNGITVEVVSEFLV
jgi:magnesium-dependent phosphatase 1